MTIIVSKSNVEICHRKTLNVRLRNLPVCDITLKMEQVHSTRLSVLVVNSWPRSDVLLRYHVSPVLSQSIATGTIGFGFLTVKWMGFDKARNSLCWLDGWECRWQWPVFLEEK